MKLLIGLGNPGERYKLNRHNAGYMFVDWVHSSQFTEDGEWKILRSDCFMNDSGKFVAEKFNFYKIPPDDLYVAHDDLDIPLGQFKIQKGTGPKVHNGINSIEQTLGTKEFWRVRIGVDARDPQNRTPGEEYVLQDFSADELETLENLFPEIFKELFRLTEGS